MAFTTCIFSITFLVLQYILQLKNATLLFFYYLSQTICTVSYQYCRAEGDNTTFAITSFLATALNILLNILFILKFGMKVNGMLLSVIISQLICAGIICKKKEILRYFCIRSFDSTMLRKLTSYSCPLVINQISSWAVNYSDRLIILLFLGKAFNGLYSVAYKFSNTINMVFNVINLAWTENAARFIDDEDSNEYFSNVFQTTYICYATLVVGVISLIPLVFKYIVNISFYESYYQVPILLIATLFSGAAASLGSIYIVYNKTKDVSTTTLLSGILNVITHLLLIKNIGLYAASISTLISFIALFLYRLIRIERFCRLSVKKSWLSIYSVLIVLGVTGYYSKNYLIIALVIIFDIFFFLVYFWITFLGKKNKRVNIG